MTTVPSAWFEGMNGVASHAGGHDGAVGPMARARTACV